MYIHILMMHWRNDNMLLRIGQADAYALAYEYVKDKNSLELKEELLKFECYHQHPSYHKMLPGCYSDDCQMSISVAEALIDSHNCVGVTQERFIKYWFDGFKRDERDGYSRNFQAILERAQTPKELLSLIKPDSTKNGAAMRSVPLGVISDVMALKAVAMRQASTTHNTTEGIQSSILIALMSHFALYDHREFSEMTEWLVTHLPIAQYFREAWVGPVQSRCPHSPYDVGINTAWAVHTLLTTQTSLLGIMKQVLEWGGDTDSVASIAWGIASARHQDEVLPEFFERDLEQHTSGKYGARFLKNLGHELMNAYDVEKEK